MSTARHDVDPLVFAAAAAAQPAVAAECAGDDDDGVPPQLPPGEAEDDPEGLCAPTFFLERDEVLAMLRAVAAKCPKDAAAIVPAEVAAPLERAEMILNKYQEAPHLIKHHLGDLLTPLVAMLIERLPRAADTSATAAAGKDDVSDAFVAGPGAQMASRELGQNYAEYDVDAPKSSLHVTARAIYFVAKVAGHKSCTSHFPHEVKHMEDVVYALLHWQRTPALHREWEVRYCLLLWLSNLILVPFALHTIDSTSDAQASLSRRILSLAIGFLGDSSKCREGAALLIARMMTRPDAQELRRTFFAFAKTSIEALNTAAAETAVAPAATQHQFLPSGVLLAVATAFKLGKREELLQYALELIPVIAPVALTFRDSVVCKTAVKTVQRLGLAALKQRAAPWKYQRKVNLLEVNLGGGGGGVGGAAGAATSADQRATNGSEDRGDANDDDDDDDVPEVIEEVLDVLLRALSHGDTIVRWSAAKGIGRICDRLGKSGADDVVQAILDTPFETFENDNGWHGGCLAVAELCRRSTLLPARFADVVPIVSKALLYDVSRGSYSVGSHVRDAACYVCWSVARAYDPADLLPYVERLSTSLVIASVFDREVNVRRASAAAFQECVGRLGNFPHGIDLITTMDFFSLAVLKNAYLVVAPKVGHFTAYLPAMIEHVATCKLYHWDRHVRRTAASALGLLSVLSVETVMAKVVPVLFQKAFDAYITVRHGAIFALAEIVANLPIDVWSAALLSELISITPTLESRRLFRGRGGEFVRQACCALLRSIAARRLAVPEHIMVEKVSGEKAKAMTHGKIQQFFDDSWKQPLEWLQDDAIDAFRVYSAAYHTTYTETFHAKMVAKVIEGTQESKAPNERRGCVLALGAVSRAILSAPHPALGTSNFVHFLKTLCALTKLEKEKDAQDAETRRNAVRALRWLFCGAPTAHVASDLAAAELTVDLMEFVSETLVAACDDYAVDKRGDVGSFVRIEAMEAFRALVEHCLGLGSDAAAPATAANTCIITTRVMTQFTRTLLKQSMEKIDRVRGVAGGCLSTFFRRFDALHSSTDAQRQQLLPEYDVVRNIALLDVVDWSSPSETFDRMVSPLLRTSTYCDAIMEGLVVSVGGLSVHVLKASWAALLHAFDDAAAGATASEVDAHQRRLTELLLAVCAKYRHNDRMVVPLALTIDKLLNAGKFHGDFLGAAVDFAKSEIKFFSTDIQKLLPIVPLIGSLCRTPRDAAAREGAWHVALSVIASRYPKVRAKMGSDFYTALLMLSAEKDATPTPAGADLAAAMDKLLTMQWDDPSAPLVRSARDELYPLLGIKKSAEDTSEVGAKFKTKSVDGTYTALVREAGY